MCVAAARASRRTMTSMEIVIGSIITAEVVHPDRELTEAEREHLEQQEQKR